MVQELLALEGKMIQGLFATPDDRFYATLLAKVQLGNFQTQEKEAEKPRVKPSKTVTSRLRYCRDCGTPHQTGSQIFYECQIDHRWRTSMEVCVYPTREKEVKNINEEKRNNKRNRVRNQKRKSRFLEVN